jgi:hypothetical protein
MSARSCGQGGPLGRGGTGSGLGAGLWRALRVLVVAAFLALPGCRGGDVGDLDGFRVDVAMAPTPPVVGPNRMVLSLRDPAGEPVVGATVRLEGTMTHAGMVPVIREAAVDGPGRYRIDDFEFTMGGDWILLVHVTLVDGRAGTLRRDTRAVSPRDS